jgi:hypothetical protein
MVPLECRRPDASPVGVGALPRFKIGDQVERIGALVPPYMRIGVITGVIPNRESVDWLTQYEVDFNGNDTTILFEMQLRLVKAAED